MVIDSEWKATIWWLFIYLTGHLKKFLKIKILIGYQVILLNEVLLLKPGGTTFEVLDCTIYPVKRNWVNNALIVII